MPRTRPVLAIFAAAFLLASPARSETCGAVERWFVKVGTDSLASSVDVNHPVPITVEALNQLPERRNEVPSGNHKFRLVPDETRVYVVQGFLAMFKNETDSDYHLVITDASFQYTPGGAGTDGQETGTSFIAEIPDPECVAGKQGTPGVPSAFQNALVTARGEFEQRFPLGKGADKFLGIPVTVTGVAFYDRQHNQTGRARNGIELHPVLDISFGGGSPITQPQVTMVELLTNPGFETGTGGWSGTTATIGEYLYEPAHGGDRVAWLCGYGRKKTETLYQTVSIPVDAGTVTLSLWIKITTEETTASTAYDKCAIQVRSSSGAILKTLATFSNLTETGGYLNKTFDLSQFRGKNVRIHLRADEDGAKQTSFIVDDLSVAVRGETP